MCGIAGVARADGQAADEVALARMAGAMRHRGPDESGTFTTDGVGLAQTRLSIVDIEGGSQPIHGRHGAVLVANGEIYNAPELRQGLADHGLCKSLSDCEPPVHLFEHEGPAYADKLRGMYAVAITDRGGQRLTLSRDPFGIKPLYYVEDAEGFAFASEPKALIAGGRARATIDPVRRDELLQLKYTTGDETIYPGVRRLRPGETLVVEKGRIVDRRRPEPAPVTYTNLPDAALPARFGEVMAESVQAHLQSDLPVSLFLSGGVDSSILLILMKRLMDNPLLAISVGYGDSGGEVARDESHAALAFAKRHGVACERLLMTSDHFWALAPKVAAALDDPTTDAAAVPTYMLGLAAIQADRKVVLCGEGSDELFAGYRRYRPRWLGLRPPSGADRKGAFSKTTILASLDPRWRVGMDASLVAARAKGLSSVETVQAADLAEWLPNDLLVKLDRCLMAHSVEGRTPYLDPKVAAFAASLPPHARVQKGLGKYVARQWLADADPLYPAFAKKKGFNPPVGVWMAAKSKALIDLLERQPCFAGWISAAQIAGVMNNAAQDSQPAWSLLFYALWHAHHIQGVSAEGGVEDVLTSAIAA
jgi:asparagine synthase (glutamine-hydrolysing)